MRKKITFPISTSYRTCSSIRLQKNELIFKTFLKKKAITPNVLYTNYEKLNKFFALGPRKPITQALLILLPILAMFMIANKTPRLITIKIDGKWNIIFSLSISSYLFSLKTSDHQNLYNGQKSTWLYSAWNTICLVSLKIDINSWIEEIRSLITWHIRCFISQHPWSPK